MCEVTQSLLNEGRIEGRIEDILDLLSDLGTVPNELITRIQMQEDIETLKKWLKLAAHTDSIENFRASI